MASGVLTKREALGTFLARCDPVDEKQLDKKLILNSLFMNLLNQLQKKNTMIYISGWKEVALVLFCEQFQY